MLVITAHLRNILGGFLKLLAVPLTFYYGFHEVQTTAIPTGIQILAWSLILTGMLGMSLATLMLFRFGSGHVHFNPRPMRLVDMGYYAHNRHPNFWFFQIYLSGILILNLGIGLLPLILLGLSIVIGSAFLRLVQEPILLKSLGDAYSAYQQETPFFYLKLRIPENRRVHFLALLVWFVSRTVFRYWYGIKVSGTAHIPHQKPLLVIANHECFLDPFLFGIFIPFELRFVTTADVFSTPLMRFLLKGIGTFPMRRHRQDLTSIRTMIRMVKQGQVVGIFPEGGRSLYGEPLPILKETLKLIQACKVPILPLHLDGAYEIWPRWAPNRRRGSVRVTINPVIPVDAQKDLDQLEEVISESIFSAKKRFTQVKSRNLAKGMDNLIWGCADCGSLNTIKQDSGKQISCRACNTHWEVSNDYALINLSTRTSMTLIQWMHQIEDGLLEKAPTPSIPVTIHENERAYLSSGIDKYQEENGQSQGEDLTLILTDQRFLLTRGGSEWKSWDISAVTVFTMDYFNAISIGVGGIRHSFFLPSEEVTLKWQTFYETIRDR